MASSAVLPCAICIPRARLRLSGLMQVAMVSPRPASPANVPGLPPMATPRRVISATPRLITMARVLSPVPRPSAIPAAIATTFFRAPPTSTPITSVPVYTRNKVVRTRLCSRCATEWSGIAMTAAAASPFSTSLARFGPDNAPAGWPGSSSPISSVIRLQVPSSKPLDRLTTGTQGRTCGCSSTRVGRNACVGTAMMITSACSAANGSDDVALSSGCSRRPAR